MSECWRWTLQNIAVFLLLTAFTCMFILWPEECITVTLKSTCQCTIVIAIIIGIFVVCERISQSRKLFTNCSEEHGTGQVNTGNNRYVPDTVSKRHEENVVQSRLQQQQRTEYNEFMTSHSNCHGSGHKISTSGRNHRLQRPMSPIRSTGYSTSTIQENNETGTLRVVQNSFFELSRRFLNRLHDRINVADHTYTRRDEFFTSHEPDDNIAARIQSIIRGIQAHIPGPPAGPPQICLIIKVPIYQKFNVKR
ncbi:uncharacterized protein LOC132719038 [Ruditapes philippinarum]|uniref:uncharacterized protein LOC132719038 n=1 Tax=Ruditapes philippinarum TaxID=129788 RepID=UPI00295B5BD6|nr:uncharacterized protein LOC132719038 [Ruditapes philippinarum]